MIRLLLFSLVFMIPTCNSMNDSDLSLTYFNKGKAIVIKEYEKEVLMDKITELISSLNQPISLIVTKELIDKIKNDDECLEIIFDRPTVFKLGNNRKMEISKLLIPLSGKYVGNEKSPSDIIFLGNNDGYITGPMGCKDCLGTVITIKKIIP